MSKSTAPNSEIHTWRHTLARRGWLEAVEHTTAALWKRERGNGLALLLRGSVVTGLMSPTSDVDVLIIRKGGRIGARQLVVGAIPFHVRWMPLLWLRLGVDAAELRHLELVLNSVPLFKRGGEYQALRRLAKRRLPRAAATLQAEVEHQLNDAAGQLDERNYACVKYLSRVAVHLWLQSMLLDAGILALKHKDVYLMGRRCTELQHARQDLLTVIGLHGGGRIGAETALKKTEEALRKVSTKCRPERGLRACGVGVMASGDQ